MKRSLLLAWLIAVAMLPLAGTAHAGHSEYDAMVAAQAQANGVPEKPWCIA